jgi:hypothetical protein
MRLDAKEQRPWARNAGFCGSMSESGDDQNSPDTVLVGRARVGVEVPQVYVVCMYNGKGRERKGVDGEAGVGGDDCGLWVGVMDSCAIVHRTVSDFCAGSDLGRIDRLVVVQRFRLVA